MNIFDYNWKNEENFLAFKKMHMLYSATIFTLRKYSHLVVFNVFLAYRIFLFFFRPFEVWRLQEKRHPDLQNALCAFRLLVSQMSTVWKFNTKQIPAKVEIQALLQSESATLSFAITKAVTNAMVQNSCDKKCFFL